MDRIVLTGGLLLDNMLVAFIGFVAIDVVVCAVGAPRVRRARNFHEVLGVMLAIGAAGIAAMAIWLTLAFNPLSGIPLAVLLAAWVAGFGALTYFTKDSHSSRDRI